MIRLRITIKREEAMSKCKTVKLKHSEIEYLEYILLGGVRRTNHETHKIVERKLNIALKTKLSKFISI